MSLDIGVDGPGIYSSLSCTAGFKYPHSIAVDRYDKDGTISIWREIQPYVEIQGYRLSDIFHADWNGDREELIEYLYERESGQVAVATRIRDSAKVILKIVTDPSRELAIHDFLLGINDSRNHTVPIIDRFPFRRPNGEQFHDWTIIVEPFLTFEWRVDSVILFEETFETWKQLLEGLAFMHLHNVAHRDIHPSNVRYISGISFSDGVPPQPEPSVQESRLLYPFRFYFIDFGISTKFASKRQHVGFVGGKYGHHCIPESKSAADDRSLLYDPFKADVAALGYSFNTGRIHQGSTPTYCFRSSTTAVSHLLWSASCAIMSFM